MGGKKDTVNLDALIPREDVSKAPAQGCSGGIPISELESGKHYYGLLRKPHFQRETDDWNVENVVSLIRSYRDGHLIPAVILWGAEGYTFVIDGAHRLSVFIAWINNDYGDKTISQAFFDHIPKRQRKIAKECRDRVEAEGLTYSDLNKLTELPNRTPEQLRWSTNIAKAIETQWVSGNADVALQSFLDINQRAVQIDPTERYMIEENEAPNVIAARAIVRSARGHQYWGKFEQPNIELVEKKARLIYNAIFEPEDAEPHKDTELQPAGPAHTANGLRMALDLVNITNNVQQRKPRTEAQKKKGVPETPRDIDADGSKTSRYIGRTHAVVKYVAGQDPASMSLHPAVYFWGATGNHRPSIFLAMVSLVQEMIEADELIKFTMHRAKFEEFLIGKSGIGKAILSKYGGWKKSVTPVKNMLRAVLDGLAAGKTEAVIEAELLAAPDSQIPSQVELLSGPSAWRETKSAIRIRASLNVGRCPICKARLVLADASDDHIERRVDGGSSREENAQLTHRFCNHGFKEHFAQKGLPLPEISSPV